MLSLVLVKKQETLLLDGTTRTHDEMFEVRVSVLIYIIIQELETFMSPL